MGPLHHLAIELITLEGGSLNFLYKQITGEFFHALGASNHQLLAVGHSGFGVGFNDPVSQTLDRVGPIPRGVYVCQRMRLSRRVGAKAIPLIPWETNHMFGRTGFYICGEENGPASGEGHIVVPASVRDLIDRERVRLQRGPYLVVQ